MKDWKKTLGVPLLSAGLVFSAFGPSAFAAEQPTTQVAPNFKEFNGGPFDAGLVNEDKLMKSLIKQGVVDKNASRADQDKALKTYVAKRAANASKRAKENNASNSNKDDAFKTIVDSKDIKGEGPHGKGHDKKGKGHDKNAFDQSKHHEKGLAGKNKLAPIQKEGWNGEVRSDKILVLLVDYPDLAQEDIDRNNPNITLNMPKYDQQHYQDMLFGENGYTGPNGENLISVRKFYEEQSGGSYTVDGTVAGWYTAKHPAAYYGGHDEVAGNDKNPRALINEALKDAANDPSVNLNDYDIEDPDDYNNNGNYREPDGIIDHLMVIHSGIGEEAGGGKLAGDAIWSHSWNLGGYVTIPGSHSNVTKERYGVDSLLGYKYTVQPEDGAAGVFAHEYGHNLGLPDEYDTQYTANSAGAAVEYWSIMAAGSWSGDIPGAEPSGFGTYDKEYLQSTMPNGNWMKGVQLNASDIDKKGVSVKIDESSVKGTNADAIRVNLPDKETPVNTPASGDYEYFGGSANDIDNTMSTTVDLSNASKAELSFKAWYDIEDGYDYAYVEVKDGDKWVPIAGNITTTDNPYGSNQGNGITKKSDGWVNATFDLSNYVGQKVDLRFRYVGDAGVANPGFYADDVKVTADGNTVLSDNAEGDSAFTFDGFTKNNGKKTSEQYYLLEWRNYAAADTALEHIRRGASLMTYDPGLVVWYVDNKYTENWVGNHPGDGFLGVVDAHQNTAKWNDGSVATSRYQVQDAAFSLNKTNAEFLDYRPLGLDQYLSMKKQKAEPLFNDSFDYSNPGFVYAGRNVPNLGLKFRVVGQSKDMSVGQVQIYR